jgi:hypothetical protein
MINLNEYEYVVWRTTHNGKPSYQLWCIFGTQLGKLVVVARQDELMASYLNGHTVAITKVVHDTKPEEDRKGVAFARITHDEKQCPYCIAYEEAMRDNETC